MKAEVYEVADIDRLCRQVAELFMDHGRRAVTERGKYIVALTGGSTVQPLYRYMAELEHREDEASPWRDTFFFWGDERWVAADHPDSNSGMAERLFLDPAEVPRENIFRIPTDLSNAAAGAAAYEATLRDFFRNGLSAGGFPVFDLILLGMGPDGHIASLFPGTDALAERETWVTDSFPPELSPAVPRVTLTLPVINRARMVLFLINGFAKRGIADLILTSPEKYSERYPAALVRPEGRLVWVIAGD
ncbi:MAG: 6-phosphogluconolactonase [Proteobacteria bacterium]|nr:6-phosphogluconolactonase [Pseudomonadota bacterium]MBU1737222.1 6-phosphogluconolactonase [Pseudomonadota bacterium]